MFTKPIKIFIITLFVLAIFFSLTRLYKSTVKIGAEEQTMPKLVQITQVSATEVVIAWHTDLPTIEAIRYQNDIGHWLLATDETQLSPLTEHVIRIKDLQKGFPYKFEIQYKETMYDNADGRNLEFALQ